MGWRRGNERVGIVKEVGKLFDGIRKWEMWWSDIFWVVKGIRNGFNRIGKGEMLGM